MRGMASDDMRFGELYPGHAGEMAIDGAFIRCIFSTPRPEMPNTATCDWQYR